MDSLNRSLSHDPPATVGRGRRPRRSRWWAWSGIVPLLLVAAGCQHARHGCCDTGCTTSFGPPPCSSIPYRGEAYHGTPAAPVTDDALPPGPPAPMDDAPAPELLDAPEDLPAAAPETAPEAPAPEAPAAEEVPAPSSSALIVPAPKS